MSAPMLRKAARDLVPGDMVIFDGARAVVTHTEIDETQRVRFLFAMLGKRDYELTSTTQSPHSQFMVELPAGLTPVQAAADKLLLYARALRACAVNELVPRMSLDEGDALRVLLDELDPPKPPTLEEAIVLMRGMQSRARASDSDAIAKFLARVPN